MSFATSSVITLLSQLFIIHNCFYPIIIIFINLSLILIHKFVIQ